VQYAEWYSVYKLWITKIDTKIKRLDKYFRSAIVVITAPRKRNAFVDRATQTR